MNRMGSTGNRTSGQRGWRRLARIWRSDTVANVDDELRFHFDQKVAEFVATGLTEAEARTRAEEEFGDVQCVRDSLAEIDSRVAKKQRRAEWWEGIAQDLRYAMRSLGRSPIFTTTVVVTLALGLGANVAVFSLLDQLYLQAPAAMTNAEDAYRIYHAAMNRGELHTRNRFSWIELRAMHDVAPKGVKLAGTRDGKVRLGIAADGRELNAQYIEGDFFGVAGAGVQLGRSITLQEARADGLDAVVVISDALWTSEFNRDPGIVGRSIDFGSHKFQVVGVAAKRFRGLDMSAADLWLPMNTVGTWRTRKPDWYADGNFNGIAVAFRTASPADARLFNQRATVLLRDPKISLFKDTLSTTQLGSIIAARGAGSYEKELKISTRLAGVSLAILLIACANVVNLLLARAIARQREIAVRLALGVSRARLLSQLLLESLVLAVMAGSVAIAVAYAGTTALRKLLLPDNSWSGTAVDERALLFTLVLAVGAGVAVGLVPALQASKRSLTSGLKSSVRDGGQRRSVLRSSLLVAQAALSVVLIVGAGAFVSSLRSIESIDIGYDANSTLYASVSFDRELSDRRAEIQRRLPEVAERLSHLPGVAVVALSEGTPMYSISWKGLYLPGRDSLPGGRAKAGNRFFDAVSPTYFKAVGMRVVQGRAFSDADRKGAEPVAIVDVNMAKSFWPGEDPLTKCIVVGKREDPCRRVVGVTAAAHYSSIVEEASEHYYIPLDQGDEDVEAGTIVVRSSLKDPERLKPVIMKEISAVLGTWSRPRTMSMTDILARDMRPWQVSAKLFTVAGLLALLVAAVGIYSSLAYTVSQRTQEMGVRVALGANVTAIIRLIVGESVLVVGIGIALGVAAAGALGSVVASMLYETSPRDPRIMLTGGLTLLAVAVAASLIPAWRASRVDPLTAMRAE